MHLPMLKKLLRAFKPDPDETPRLRDIVERLEGLERRLDADGIERDEWYGKMRRVLARINRANERSSEPELLPAATHATISDSDYAQLLATARSRFGNGAR